MAVIVLNGADFSANNIGQIDLFNGFSEDTLALFEKFSITSDESNDMQRAVDKFVRSLVDNELWGNGKIDLLCLPFLTNLSDSPSFSDAIQNCISDEPVFWRNTENIELLRNGLVPKKNGGAVAQFNIIWQSATTGYDLSKTDFHMAFYPLENQTIQYPGGTRLNVAFMYANMIVGFFNIGSGFRTAADNQALMDSNYQGKSRMTIGTRSTTYSDGKPRLYTAGQETVGQNTNLLGNNWQSSSFGRRATNYYASDYTPSAGGDDGQLTAPVGLISFGGYLTGEEAVIYTNAANKLIQAVHQYMED